MIRFVRYNKKYNVSYDASSIQILKPMEAIRKKVSMYLGSSDSDAIFHMFREVVDNAIDEKQAGHNTFIGVIIDDNGYIYVVDKGRGIPIDIKEETNRPVIIDIFTSLHAGGKFNTSNYTKGSIGTHGVGIKATNALSKILEVWTFRKGNWYNVSFKKGELAVKLNKSNPPKLPIKVDQGSILKFKPDLSCFDEGSKLSINKVKRYCELIAYLHAGLKVYLKTPKNEYSFYQKDGLSSLLKKQLEQLHEEQIEPLSNKHFILSEFPIDIAIAWTTSDKESITSYVSGSLTKEGGTHVDGLLKAITDSLKEYKGKKDFTPADLRAGIIGTINVMVSEPKFSSQSKERLTKAETHKHVYDIVKPELEKYFKDNKSLVKRIIARAEELNALSERFTANRKSIAALKNKKELAVLSSKLASCKSKDPNKTELFLVEGDSAGGTAKDARDKEFQAVLPLRGKVINAFRADPAKLFNNNEVKDILRSVGYDADSKKTRLKYGKVILLTDPDVDGKHISNLILSLFQKVLPESYVNEQIYAIDSPLFNTQLANGKKVYGASVKDVRAKLEKMGAKESKEGIQRIKGWGEVKSPTLKDIAFDRKTRKLTKLIALEGHDIIEFANLVGENTEERVKLLKL